MFEPSPDVESRRTEDRAASEAAHCWGWRMSFNAFFAQNIGIAFPGFRKRDSCRNHAWRSRGR
jgi:hypothetical protein